MSLVGFDFDVARIDDTLVQNDLERTEPLELAKPVFVFVRNGLFAKLHAAIVQVLGFADRHFEIPTFVGIDAHFFSAPRDDAIDDLYVSGYTHFHFENFVRTGGVHLLVYNLRIVYSDGERRERRIRRRSAEQFVAGFVLQFSPYVPKRHVEGGANGCLSLEGFAKVAAFLVEALQQLGGISVEKPRDVIHGFPDRVR